MDVQIRHFVAKVFVLTVTLLPGCAGRQDREETRITQTSVGDHDGQMSSDDIDIICALIRVVADDDFVLTGCRIELKHLSLADAIIGKDPLDRWPADDRQPDDVAIATALVSRNKNEIHFNSELLDAIGLRLGKFDFERDDRFFIRTVGSAVPPSIQIAVAIPGISVKEGEACTFAEVTNAKAGSSFVVWSRIRRSDDGWRCTDRKIIGFE